jgi:hypothetical protein
MLNPKEAGLLDIMESSCGIAYHVISNQLNLNQLLRENAKNF